MTPFDFFNFHVRNICWCIHKGFPLRMVLCDVWFKDIPASTKFFHPYGITIRTGVKIGENCMFASNVTIGMINLEQEYTTIGNNVFFGAGCSVLGHITIGDNVIIGANRVITKDIPERI